MEKWVVMLAGGVLAGCGGLVQAQGTTDGGDGDGETAAPDVDVDADDDGPPPGDDGMSSGGSTAADSTGGGAPVADGSSSSDGPAATDATTTTDDTTGASSDGPGPMCGDGRPDDGEACDDANRSEIDGCTSQCEVGPLDLSYGSASTTEEDGGNGTNVTPFSDDCPAGQVLTGMTGRLTSQGLGTAVVLGRIQGECSSLSLLDADPTAIDTGPGISLIEHGGYQEGGDWELSCPEGSVVTAFEGRAGSIIDSLEITCTPLEVAGTGGAQVLELGLPSSDGPVGGNGGGPFGPVACPDGEIGSGLAGDTNSYVIRLALRCREVALQYP